MKKLLFILIVVLFSCEKAEYCWECRIKTEVTEGVVIEFCDKTEKEIRHIEDINTFSNALNNWHQQSCKCEIKIKP